MTRFLFAALAACGSEPEPVAPVAAEAPEVEEKAYEPYVAGPAEVQYGVCVQCHGLHGEGRPELGAPRIGQLDAEYVTAQLRSFRAGTRGYDPEDESGQAMRAVAAGLPDEAIELLGPFVEDLDPAPQAPTAKVSGGAAAYGVCSSCHGPDGLGNEALQAPALAQQHPAYLTRQLRHYRDGGRGGPQGAPLGMTMAAQATGLSDDRIERLVAHIGSLREEPPPLENPPVTRSRDEGLAAFADIYAVATHPRCMNCHPDGDAPMQGDDSHAHIYGITRFSPLEGTHCSTCHAPKAVGDGQVPLPPADAVWSMPPQAMAFQNRTQGELCNQLKNPATNGGRGLGDLAEHIEHDHLLVTSWHSGRETPPITHAELVERYEIWAEAGGPCPE
ncbi:MAG: c-type cytochrome [Myxococcota bacterium]